MCRGYEKEGVMNSIWGSLWEGDRWAGLQRWMEFARWASGRGRIAGGRGIYAVKAQTQKTTQLVLLDYKMRGWGKSAWEMYTIERHISTVDFIYINIATSKWRGLETGQEEVTVARSWRAWYLLSSVVCRLNPGSGGGNREGTRGN